MHRVPWRGQTDQRHRVEFLKYLEKEQNQRHCLSYFIETNQGTGPNGTKKEEQKTNQGTGPMKLDSSGDCIWSYVHPLQLLDNHHAVLGRVCKHQLQKYIFCLSSCRT